MARKNTFHTVKKAPIKEKKAHTLALPLLTPMNKSNYKIHNIFGNYSSQNYIKIHSRMHPKFKKLSWKSIPLNPLAIKLNSVIRAARQCKWDELQ